MDVLTTWGHPGKGVADPLAGRVAFACTDHGLLFVMEGGYVVNEIGANVAGMPTGFLS